MNKKNEAKMSKAHERTDRILGHMENDIDDFYGKSSKKIIKIFDEFYELNKDDFEQKLNDYNEGKITKDEYRQYMFSKTIYSDEWRKTVDKMSNKMVEINQQAISKIIDKNVKGIYLDNYNTTIETIGGELLEN